MFDQPQLPSNGAKASGTWLFISTVELMLPTLLDMRDAGSLGIFFLPFCLFGVCPGSEHHILGSELS